MKSVKEQVIIKVYLNQDVHLNVVDLIQKTLWSSRIWQIHGCVWDDIWEIFGFDFDKE